MSCNINRNDRGLITKVTTKQGVESKLFEELDSNIFQTDADISLKIYMNALTPEIESLFEGAESNVYDTGEPKVFYQDEKGNIHGDVETLLLEGASGKITMGFKTPDNTEFLPIARINTEASKQSKFVVDKIKEGVLEATTVKGKDGINKYQGKGQFSTTKYITGLHVKDSLEVDLLVTGVTIDKEGVITINDEQDFVEVEFETGQKKIVKKSTIPELLINNNIKNKAELALLYVNEYANPIPLHKNSKETGKVIESESDLVSSMFNFLESLGFTVTSLESYRKNFNTKYGKDVDIDAITDIANKLVAFSNGMVNIEDLSEEVAHIAIESYSDQESIAGALINAHMLNEYQEYSEYYRTKYAPFLEGVELEDQVRKEVLGKALKNAFLSRFDNEGKTEIQEDVSNKLRQIWDRFITFITGNMRSYHVNDINELNQRIIDSVVNNRTETFSEDIMNPNAFYYAATSKAMDGMQAELQKMKSNIETLFRKGIQKAVPNQYDLDKISEAHTAVDLVSSVLTILGITQNQLDVLLTDTTEAYNNGDMVTMQDSSRYAVLKYDLMPSLVSIRADLQKLKADQSDPRIKKQIDFVTEAIVAANAKLLDIEPKLKSGERKQAEAMLEAAIELGNLTEEEAAQVRIDATNGIKDIGVVGRMFGISSQSRNPWIQLMHKEIVSMQVKTRNRLLRRFNSLVAEIVSKGLEVFQKDIINYNKDGKTFYYLSPRDYAWYDKALLEVQATSIANLTGQEVSEVKEELKTKRAVEILTEEQLTVYKKEVKDWKNKEGVVRRFKQEYYNEGEERFVEAGVSEETQNYLQDKNIAKFERVKKYVNKDGTIDRSKMTTSEKIEEANDLKQHKRVKSAVNSSGELKIGLKTALYEELTQMEKDALPYFIDPNYKGYITLLSGEVTMEELPNESRRSLDLNNLDALFLHENKEGTKTRNPVAKFFDKIKEIEDNGQSSYDWVMANSSISLSEKFYDDVDFGVSYIDAAQEYIDSIEDGLESETKQNILIDIISIQKLRKEIIKHNKKGSNTLEVDVHNMTTEVKSKLLYLEEELSTRKASLRVPSEFFEDDADGLVSTEIQMNSDFEKMRIEYGLSVYELALEHMTTHNKNLTLVFAKQIDALINGRTLAIDKTFDSFLGDLVEKGLLEGKTTQESVEVAKEEYAKKNVAGYFKRYQPTGYSEFIESMKNGDISMKDVINKENIPGHSVSEYVDINPEFSWNQDNVNEDMINPNYVAGGPGIKPNKLNDAFFEFFGIAKEDYLALEEEDLLKMTPTRNTGAYELLIHMTNLREETQINYGDQNSINKYSLVQISKNNFEKVLYLNKGSASSFKDFFSDIAYSKIDEKSYGEQADSGTSIKVIPKYYQSKLETPDLVTDNILEAAIVDLKASIKYDEVHKSEVKLRALDAQISEQQFRNTGGKLAKSRVTVKGAASGYAKKSQEMLDNYLYGIRESRRMTTDFYGKEIDFTQLFNTLTGFVAKLNLAFNPISDVTSLTTGVYNNFIDAAAGDYYTKEANFAALRQLPIMMGKYFAESGKLVKTSDLNHILEFFGVEDAEEKLKQSYSNRAIRLINKSEFAMSKAANMPVIPKVVLALMHDNKIVGNRFMSYNQFVKLKRQENKSISQVAIKAEWNKNKESFFNNIIIDKTKGVLMKDSFKEAFGDQASKIFEETQIDLTTKANQVIAGVDGRLTEDDQLGAQRDAMTNALLLHRSWFIINLTRKFKGRHYNIATGQIEGGHYKGILKNLKNRSLGLVTGNPQKVYDQLEAYDKRNLRRLGVDTTLIIILTGLVNAMLKGGDDEDDGFIENFAQLIALRTVSEAQSQNIIGIAETTMEMYKSPIVQITPFEQVYKATKAYKKGDTDGGNHYMRNLFTPTKRYNQLYDLDKTLGSYVYHNGGTLYGIDRSKYMR